MTGREDVTVPMSEDLALVESSSRQDQSPTEAHDQLLPRPLVGSVAIVCAVVLAAVAILGPLVLGTIEYRTSTSGVWQIEGADVVNLFLVTPILLLGGILHLMGRPGSRYLLILPPVTLMYTGLSVGMGQEWGDPAYDGNVEQYAWLFLVLIIGGLVLLIASLSMFTERDAPAFKPRNLRIYVAVMSLFLLLFAMMWLSELAEVISTGDTSTGSYEATPTLWWIVRYLDLGITIPLGFVGLFLLLTRTRQAYPLVLLFFGFFVTLGTAVLSMGIVMTLNDDPEAQPGALLIFATLAALSWVGLLYLLWAKLPRSSTKGAKTTGRS